MSCTPTSVSMDRYLIVTPPKGSKYEHKPPIRLRIRPESEMIASDEAVRALKLKRPLTATVEQQPHPPKAIKKGFEGLVLAIVGWRGFTDYELFNTYVTEWIQAHDYPDWVISGGAVGADAMAERWAAENDIRMHVFHPDKGSNKGKGAFIDRDRLIAEACTHLLAFPSFKEGKGTQHTIRFAEELGRKVHVVDVDKLLEDPLVVEGDLLEAKEDIICHQCNCVVRGYGRGLAQAMYKRYPYANIYRGRVKDDVPGHVVISGNGNTQRWVANLLAQRDPGHSIKGNDTPAMRLEWMKQCLEELASDPRFNSYAFPYLMGCALAGGDWKAYRKLIGEFAEKVKKPVKLYKLNK